MITQLIDPLPPGIRSSYVDENWGVLSYPINYRSHYLYLMAIVWPGVMNPPHKEYALEMEVLQLSWRAERVERHNQRLRGAIEEHRRDTKRRIRPHHYPVSVYDAPFFAAANKMYLAAGMKPLEFHCHKEAP